MTRLESKLPASSSPSVDAMQVERVLTRQMSFSVSVDQERYAPRPLDSSKPSLNPWKFPNPPQSSVLTPLGPGTERPSFPPLFRASASRFAAHRDPRCSARTHGRRPTKRRLLRGSGRRAGCRLDDGTGRTPRDVGRPGAAGGPVLLRRRLHLRHGLRSRVHQLHSLLVP